MENWYSIKLLPGNQDTHTDSFVNNLQNAYTYTFLYYETYETDFYSYSKISVYGNKMLLYIWLPTACQIHQLGEKQKEKKNSSCFQEINSKPFTIKIGYLKKMAFRLISTEWPSL